MKKILFLSFFALGFFACEDDLFQDPLTEKSVNNFFSNEGEIESAVNGVYAALQSLYNLNIPVLGEIASDNTFDEVPANDGGRYGQLDEFTTIPSNEIITATWRDSYVGIQRANIVLNRIDAINFNDNSVKNARIGEVKFIRALLYFNLVRIFGDVPLVLEETTDPTVYFGQGRTPIAQVYAQIEQDLTESISSLPTNADIPGKVVKSAAETLLAKVRLSQNNFSGAKTLLDGVVASNKYTLLDDPNAVFDINNELNKEIIFAVQFASGVNGNGEGSAAFQQFAASGTVNGAKGHNLPTRSLIALYTTADLRAEAYVGVTEQGTPFHKKYKEPTTEPADGGSDWVLLRYADVLLMLAEAENELGNTSDAANYLNQIRNRAGLSNTTANSKADLSIAIELERRLELIGEGHRWFDLIRTGKAISTMNTWFSTNTNLGISIDEHDLLLPIPQSQINTDLALTQNIGY